MTLSSTISTLTQNSAAIGTLSNREDMQRFRELVEEDIAKVYAQVNNVYYPVLSVLNDDAINGLFADYVQTYSAATTDSLDIYWSQSAARALSIKETFDVMLSRVIEIDNRLTSLAMSVNNSTDLSSLQSDVSQLTNRVSQLSADTFEGNYAWTGSSSGALTYSVIQAVEALGTFFAGWPGLGVTSFSNTFPTLSLTVLLSTITLDTTIASSTITDLDTWLANIYSYTGMGSGVVGSPTYSAHGTLVDVSDGQPLDQAVGILDDQKLSRTQFAGTHSGLLARTGTNAWTVIRYRIAATVPPTVTNDAASDYSVGSRWFDITADEEYVCLDNTVGAAVWKNTTNIVPVITTITSQTTTERWKEYILDVSGGAFNVLVPASPTEGDAIKLHPGNGSLASNNVNVRDNGDTTNLYTLNVDDTGVEMRYLNGSWKFKGEVWL